MIRTPFVGSFNQIYSNLLFNLPKIAFIKISTYLTPFPPAPL